VLVVGFLSLPTVPAGNPFSDTDFSWKFVNYSPILTFGAILLLAIWWQASAKRWFTGPITNIDTGVVEAFDD